MGRDVASTRPGVWLTAATSAEFACRTVSVFGTGFATVDRAIPAACGAGTSVDVTVAPVTGIAGSVDGPSGASVYCGAACPGARPWISIINRYGFGSRNAE